MSGLAIAATLLHGAAPVAAVVGASGVYPDELPEGAAPPALVLRLISDVPTHDVSLAQPVVLMRARVQVDAITAHPGGTAQRVALLLAARRALHGVRGTVAGFAGVVVTYAGDGPALPHTRAGLASGSADFLITYLQPAA